MTPDDGVAASAHGAVIADWFGLKAPNRLAELMLADLEGIARRYCELPAPDLFADTEPFADVLVSLRTPD